MSKSKFVAIRNQADSSTLELYFLDVIQDTYDFWSGMVYSKVQEIIDKVNYYKPSKIKCIIDSEGGDAQTGLSIYNFLVRCDAKVECEIIGLAGSIASVIAMAANKGRLRIARNAFMMIHKAEGVCYGTADEIRQAADLVDLYTNQIVDIYSQRTGKTVDAINKLIENGDYWMAGEDCVSQGFADETFNEVTPNLQIAARLDTNVYKNIPAQIRAQLKPATEKPDDSQTNKILSEMSKLGEKIANLFKNHKPAAGADLPTVLNQVGEIMKPGLDEFETGLETMITEKANEAVTAKIGADPISAQVNTAVTAAVDFSKEGPAKVALEAAVKLSVEAATKDYATKITALETAKTDLENEITQIKGKKTTNKVDEPDTPEPIGKWVKA